MADWAGAAAKDLAAKLALDTTMTGPEKIFRIGNALVQTAINKGVKADAGILFSVLLDIAQAAYRATLPNIDSKIIALAAAFSSNPLVGTVAALVDAEVEQLVDKWGGPAPTAAANPMVAAVAA